MGADVDAGAKRAAARVFPEQTGCEKSLPSRHCEGAERPRQSIAAACVRGLPRAGCAVARNDGILIQPAIGDDGVVFVEDEFCQAGRVLEERATQLASALERYRENLESLGHLETRGAPERASTSGSPVSLSARHDVIAPLSARGAKKAVAALADASARMREAGRILEEACVAYVEGVNDADQSLSRGKASMS
jgi:hypothetical protein